MNSCFAASAAGLAERLRAEKHTLERPLTDPHTFDGIGNACSDEILHRARLSTLLHDDWPRTLAELEGGRRSRSRVEDAASETNAAPTAARCDP